MRLVVIGLAPPSWTHVVDQLLEWVGLLRSHLDGTSAVQSLHGRTIHKHSQSEQLSFIPVSSLLFFLFFFWKWTPFLKKLQSFFGGIYLIRKKFISKESFAKQSLNQIASFSITLNWNNFPWLSQLGWRFSETLWIWEEVPFHPTLWEGSLCPLIELPVLEMGKLRPGACHPTFIEQDYVYTYTHTHLHKYLSVSLCAYSHILKSSLKERH